MAIYTGKCHECGKTTSVNQKVLGWDAYCEPCEQDIFSAIK